jgi:serine/threonine protein kinase
MSTPYDKVPVTGLMAERERGRASGAAQPGHTLPLGTRLRDYEITGLIGEGGFGIVYLAWDHSLQRKVAIKEYMPSSMAARVAGSSAIIVKSERHLDTFKAGLKSFVNEARLLARFDHPSLVKVYRFWEENGTAYMVMPYYEGPTLKAALADLGHVPSEAEIRAWLKPILNALTVMHAAQCYHRDIAPDNILLTPRGPLLLDFGAARRVIGDMTHAITVVLKPGYAPIEQYGDVASMTQGAWTDLYALACVVYFAITGKTPTSSVERLMDDRLEPLAVTLAGRYSPAFLRAIDAALAVRPGDRPQDDRQFRALLDADLPAPFAATSASMALDDAPASRWPELAAAPQPDDDVEATRPGPLVPELATQVLLRPAAPADVRPQPAPVRGLVVAVGIATITALAVVWWVMRDDAPKVEPAVAASTAAPEPTITAPAATVAAPPASEPTALPVESTAPSASVPAPASTSAPLASGTDSTTAIDAAPAARPREDIRVATPVPTPAAASRPHREPAVPRGEASTETKPAPARTSSASGKCSDILQKASLEPLTAEESAYLKRECR